MCDNLKPNYLSRWSKNYKLIIKFNINIYQIEYLNTHKIFSVEDPTCYHRVFYDISIDSNK